MLSVERLGVLLAPKDENHAKFNAGMVKQGDKVHMVYRWSKQNGIATDANEKKTGIVYLDDFVSYAELTPEGKLVSDLDEQGLIKYYIENPKTPVYAQDPRIVEFEGEYIIFFVRYDLKICRVGMARTKDFKKIEPIGIIPSNDWDKDAFILPERINGKIVYIHRIEPNIQIDYFDSFDEMIDPEYGGKDKLLSKLDELFAAPPLYRVTGYGFEIHEMTELAAQDYGQCAISNQPSFHLPYIYAYFGEVEKARYWVHKMALEAMSYEDDGFPGDEDNGTMSAWYIFACLGEYPLCPGNAENIKIPGIAKHIKFRR